MHVSAAPAKALHLQPPSLDPPKDNRPALGPNSAHQAFLQISLCLCNPIPVSWAFAFFLTWSPSAVSQFPRWEPARFLWASPPSLSPHHSSTYLASSLWGQRCWLLGLHCLARWSCSLHLSWGHFYRAWWGRGRGSKPCNLSELQFPHQESKDNLTYSSELLYRVNGTMHVKSGARNLAGAQ